MCKKWAWILVFNWYYTEMVKETDFFMGIDGGGTGCRALLCKRDGTAIGVGLADAANVMTGFDRAVDNISIATRLAFEQAGQSIEGIEAIPVVLGLAGANIGTYAARLKSKLPFKRCHITTDAETALEGAVGSGDGVAAIIGTGSVFAYRMNGNYHTVGGWGFMVGDLASGAWLGRRLLQETLLSFDRIRKGTSLTCKVLDDFQNNPQSVVEYAHTAKPGEFGKLAPMVFEFAKHRDPIARRIINRALSDIEETLDKILPDDEGRFCMIGGLGPVYAGMLSSCYRERLREPIADSATGAAKLAVQMFVEEPV